MKITFLPKNKVCNIKTGMTILECAALSAIDIDGNCSGAGTCGKCKVKLIEGNDYNLDDAEKKMLSEKEVSENYRLACRCKPTCDIVVRVPLADTAVNRKTKLFKLPDWFNCGKADRKGYGIAFDIGTTTVVAMLWRYETGELVDIKAISNPQGAYGADVISRIMYAGESAENLKNINGKITDCLNRCIDEFVSSNKINKNDISMITVVGNTTMSHIFLGVDPTSLALAPFTPVFLEGKNAPAKTFGINAGANTELYLLPNLAGHVGSDITAGVLATNILKENKNELLIDIGTNGEIVLVAKGRAITCSTAAGPAFEGATIYKGMRAAEGAIEEVYIDKDKVDIEVIDSSTPVGICGSGIIDAVAQLAINGIIDATGKFLKKEELSERGYSSNITDRIRMNGRIVEFVLAYVDNSDDIVITQKDIREVQLAKAAIRAGINILMKCLEVQASDLDRINIAGAFGNYIDKESALAIGLAPEIELEKIVSVGNAAGVGASIALLSKSTKKDAEDIGKKIEHIELSTYEGFQEEYFNAMKF